MFHSIPVEPRDVPPRPFPTYSDLSYQDFLHHHLIPNSPFILSPTSTTSWPCHSWRSSTSTPLLSRPSSTSIPNLEALRKYAHHIVPVANTQTREYSEFARDERPLGTVLDIWSKGEGKGLYVKDWHLFQEVEKEGRRVEEIYVVPPCFRDDWMNPPYTNLTRNTSDTTSDFRFCYIGPPGTFTPLHMDVYASYSWSANIVGRKVWWLFPSDRVDGLKVDGRDDELVFDVRTLKDEGGGIKILQQEGEIIFVPSGWYHQVVNLDFCISVNHNFAASPTLSRLVTAMINAQHRVEKSIDDVKEMIQSRLGMDGPWEEEWVEEVQGLLERDAGWGWKGFWEMLQRNVEDPPDAQNKPPKEMVDGFMRGVIDRYRLLPEWELLSDVRAVVLSIEGMLNRSKS